ncbi:PREDICTED: RING-H2 finger protein ATL52-like [Camelina sativa]|uniref:RING-type E3 ubiquitin transferase n=1 Tax=Camelina sativa TaxID=90675 RepID=A0ABM1QHX5_CAMSA|nr:PREDICTED: RING-H2 finger protein ATL52-like [Camelina sativa]
MVSSSSSWSWKETLLMFAPIIFVILALLISIIWQICIKLFKCIQPPPTEPALETHQNPPLSLPHQDIETGHLGPPQSQQQDIKTGYESRIKEVKFKDIIKEDGFGDKICCSICLEEFEDGHAIVHINKCRHVFHRFCIVSWLKQNRSCPNCRRF